MAEPIELEQKIELLKNQHVFAQLNADEHSTLASILVEKKFKAGDVIVNEGDPVDSIFIVVTGTADVRHIRFIDGQPQITSLIKIGPGEAIGLNEKGFYSISGVRTATVVADTEITALRLSMAAFHGFTLTNAHASEVIRNLSNESDKIDDTN